jgi:small subunit ribosomal protein S7
MPRGGKVILKRSVVIDNVTKSVAITKLINHTMRDGKKTVAQKLIYKTLEIIKEKTGKDPLEFFNTALENIKPQMEVKSRRTQVRGERKETLAIRWLLAAARARSSKEMHTFSEKLAAEIIDASNGLGGAYKKKEDVHRMAEANKAFAHFRW